MILSPETVIQHLGTEIPIELEEELSKLSKAEQLEIITTVGETIKRIRTMMPDTPMNLSKTIRGAIREKTIAALFQRYTNYMQENGLKTVGRQDFTNPSARVIGVPPAHNWEEIEKKGLRKGMTVICRGQTVTIQEISSVGTISFKEKTLIKCSVFPHCITVIPTTTTK